MGLLDDLYSTELGAIRAVPGTTRANYDKLKGLLGVDSTGNGLLSDLGYGARNALSQAKWNAGNRLDKIQQYLTDPSARFQPSTPESRASIDEALMNLGSSVMPGGMAGMIKASHGSPHMFDRFDFTKIGTGEGAQAYGHGGYFAQGFDSPVAQEYMNVKDKIGSNASYLAKTYLKKWKEKDKALEALNLKIGKLKEEVNPDYIAPYQEAASRIASGSQDFGPYLYNVELRWPDAAREAADPLGEHHLLDWDAPLSEQPQMMKFINEEEAKTTKKALDKRLETLASIGESHPNAESVKRQIELLREEMESPSESGLKRLTGGEYFNYLRRRNIDPKSQSEMLLQYGIPGIRYLDQASRGAGEGTRNYVMFDDAIPRIVTRNGRSLLED